MRHAVTCDYGSKITTFRSPHDLLASPSVSRPGKCTSSAVKDEVALNGFHSFLKCCSSAAKDELALNVFQSFLKCASFATKDEL